MYIRHAGFFIETLGSVVSCTGSPKIFIASQRLYAQGGRQL